MKGKEFGSVNSGITPSTDSKLVGTGYKPPRQKRRKKNWKKFPGIGGEGLGGMLLKKSTGSSKVVCSLTVGVESSGATLRATTTESRSDDGRPVVDQAEDHGKGIATDLGSGRISDDVGNSVGRGLDIGPQSKLSTRILTESGEIEVPSSINLLECGETCLQLSEGEQAGVGDFSIS